MIEEDDTVGFDIGTTVPFIAKWLKDDVKIDAVCVSVDCAMEFYHKENTNLILSGGYLHRDSGVFFQSDEGFAFLGRVRTDKVFLSAAGIHPELGLTCYHDFHVSIKRKLMNSTGQIILVADSTKFGMLSPVYFADLKEIDILVTDDGIPSDYRMKLQDLGVDVVVQPRFSNANLAPQAATWVAGVNG